MLFDAHARAFAAFGGVPRRGIYDNMKTAVDKVGRGKERSVNARFEAMCGHYLFEPEFCNRAAGCYYDRSVVPPAGPSTVIPRVCTEENCRYVSYDCTYGVDSAYLRAYEGGSGV
jgi:hypothetical protein